MTQSFLSGEITVSVLMARNLFSTPISPSQFTLLPSPILSGTKHFTIVALSHRKIRSKPPDKDISAILSFPKLPQRRESEENLTCTTASSPPRWNQSRRVISFSFFPLLFQLFPNNAMAGSLMDKYVKRKKLDPLEAYVPPVILAQLQIQDLDKFLSVEKPEFEACRSVLRSGPASSLRVNIRAVAQYASDAGYSKSATDDVDRCLRALEELDSLFLRASRKDPKATVELMKSQLGTTLTALDSLLQTVPTQVLDKGKAMVEVYRSSSEEGDEVSDSSEIKQLESIL